tara:strand:- start:578 stop:1609 length:1032 start_codon:yes stop_codon:yes gene_type:complete
MLAAVLFKSKQKLRIEEIKVPEKLEYGQVLVKIFYSSICGAQLNEIDAAKGKDNFLPHLLGHEGSGKVLKVGKGVKSVKPGDKVVLHWRKGDGIQSETPSYDLNGKKINAGWVTTFNEKAVVSENRLTKIPYYFDLKIAPLFGCAITTAMGVVNNDANVKIGQSVIIFGLGGLGLSLAKTLQLVSANPIIGVDNKSQKLKIAKKIGLQHVFLNQKNINRKIRNIIKNDFADVVIDTTGNTKVIQQSYNLTASKGKTILCGVPNHKKNVNIHTLPLHFNKILKGSHGGDSNPSEDIPRFIKLMEKKKIKLHDLITHEYDFHEINKAIKVLRSGVAGRILIKISR